MCNINDRVAGSGFARLLACLIVRVFVLFWVGLAEVYQLFGCCPAVATVADTPLLAVCQGSGASITPAIRTGMQAVRWVAVAHESQPTAAA